MESFGEGMVGATSLEDESPQFRELVHKINPQIEVESYWVVTADGYKLKVFRLVKHGAQPQHSFFLQHGMFQSANDWVTAGTKSFAIQLLDQGYDVWLGNSRGNMYSRTNIKYSAESDPE